MPPRPDDTSIEDHAHLWRRVHPTQISRISESGALNVSAGVFSTRDEVSVALAGLTTLASFRENHSEHSVVQLTASQARAVGCTVVRDPLENDPAHALICGTRSHGQLSKTQQNELSRICTVIFIGRIAGTV